MKFKPLALAAAFTIALALPIVASAQTAPAPTGNVSARVEQRLQKMHTALGITPAEEPLWNDYAQVTRGTATAMSSSFAQRRTALPTMNAVANIQNMAATADQHAQNMQRLAASFTKLYAAMPPAQQKIADDVLRTPGERPKP